MTIRRHPDDLTLMGYAAGTLAEPIAAVVAAHVDLCRRCRTEVDDLERVGAALMGAPGASDAESHVRNPPPDRPREGGVAGHAQTPKPGRAGSLSLPAAAGAADDTMAAGLLPRPLRRRWAASSDGIRWFRLGRGVWHHRLPLSEGATGDLRLLKVEGRVALPEHGHHGSELTLVLAGGFSDATGHFGPGDVEDVDAAVEHKPVADPEGCICLVGSEGPVRFTGLGVRLWQAFRRW